MVLRDFPQQPINLYSDSHYVVGVLHCIETAYIGHTSSEELFNLFFQLCSLMQSHLFPCFVSHLCSHSNLPGPLADSNAWADNLVSGLALGLPMETVAPIRAAQLSHDHQNALALGRQFISIPPHTLVRPLSMSSLTVWLCGVEGMFVFFLKMQNTQCGYHHSLSSLMDPLVPKMRRLSLEDSPWDREPLRLTPPLTTGRTRKRLMARQTRDSEPPIWGQIKKLIDKVTMVISSLGWLGIPQPHCWWHWSSLQRRWVLSKAMDTGLSCPTCQWCILPLGRATLYLSLLMIWCTWEVIPQDIWCLNIVTIALQVKVTLWAHEVPITKQTIL
jgi:hypothetical protein